MKRNGIYALDFHGPALIGGEIKYLRGRQFLDKVLALCFLPYPGLVPTEMIDRQACRLREVDATLLLVASGTRPLHRLWRERGDKPTVPVMTDLCGRLHRAFGVAVVEPGQRCHTFVIDRTGVLRLRLSHDFVEHDLTILRAMIGASHNTDRNDFADSADSRGARAACLSV